MKLTHDGAFAVIDNGKLLICTEAEKVDNSPRYSELNDLARIRALLTDLGLDFDALDVSVDGWVQFHGGATEIPITMGGRRHPIPVAGYDERRDPRLGGAPLTAIHGRFPDGPAYRSFAHATGHVFSAYCTGPAAAADEPSLVLVWDGGMPACLYRVDPGARAVRAYGVVLDITGAIYPTFAAQLDPFRLPPDSHAEAYLPISGKAMAYAGLGAVSESGLRHCADRLAERGGALTRRTGAEWSTAVIADMAAEGASAADMIATMQHYLGQALVAALRPFVAEVGPLPLAFAGGCALNIKWNATLRASGLFTDVWVPPFPNDSGSAIGAACAALAADGGPLAVEWDVFSGPRLRDTEAVPEGWTTGPATIEDVARLLHTTGEPVVVLSGPAELGPRALGHRSIVAPAVDAAMRDRLNDMKGREHYRPVAPICIEERSSEVFDPGGADRYMLFDHRVRPEWRDRVPAIMHVDGSARLQTVDSSDNPLVARLLEAYHAVSGVPVLCNTSANHPGRGFFPDVASAIEWGRARYVWSDGVLYRRADA